VVRLDPFIPPDDITLVGTTAKVLIRDDLHPAIVQLLAQTLKEEHSGPELFQRSGKFPSINDPEYAVSPVAIEFYRNGPSLLLRYLPLSMTTYVMHSLLQHWQSFFQFLALRQDCTGGLSDNAFGSFISGSELLKVRSEQDSRLAKPKP